MIFQIIYSLIRNSIWGCSEDPLVMEEIGHNSGAGNIIGIQPYMEPKDYGNEREFYEKLGSYIENASKKGWINEKTIVVFPEYIGTWLVMANESNMEFKSVIFVKEVLAAIFSHLGSGVEGILQQKSKTMVRIYDNVFSGLAKKYRITLVAGSIVLPSPVVKEGKLTIGSVPLYNVTVVYQPDGTPYENIVKKVQLIPIEKPFTTSGCLETQPVFDTPVGKLGILICFASCFHENYQHLKKKEARIIVSPAFFPAPDIMDTKWNGFHGMIPENADLEDLKRISYGEAWIKYGLGGGVKTTGARYGMNVFFRGNFFGYIFDGATIVIRGQEVMRTKRINGASITNLWLEV